MYSAYTKKNYLRKSATQKTAETFWAELCINPAGIYLFNLDNGNTRTMYETCSKLAIKKSEQPH